MMTRPKSGHLQRLRRRPVLAQLLLHRLEDLLPVLLLLHVDEVETMMPPRSRSRICRTISFTASRLVLRIVSSSRPAVFLPT
jgi:hypothetical protein